MMKIANPAGSTPLTAEDLVGLIPKHIVTQDQLNEWEHANIVVGERWAYSIRHKELFDVAFLCKLHKKMFDQTWSWAGTFRKRQTNIGVEWHQIAPKLKLLCDDFKYFNEHNSYPNDELAIRFHHLCDS